MAITVDYYSSNLAGIAPENVEFGYTDSNVETWISPLSTSPTLKTINNVSYSIFSVSVPSELVTSLKIRDKTDHSKVSLAVANVRDSPL